MKEVAQEVLKIFSSFGYKAYIVGGFPRNQYLNINSNDIDICTNATPNEIETKMSKVFNIKNKNGINYGSITIIYKNYNFEITTFRKEKKYINNRKPSEINYVDDLKEDLSRRDFIMNTLCIDSNGNYIDNLNARKDIENKIINTVGKSDKKIKEDVLRILRAIRFATTLNFKLSDELEQAIKKNKKNLKKLSYDRKKHELDLIFSHPNVLYGISLLKKLELMKFLDLKDTNIIKTSRIGVWFQLDDRLKYPYTTQEKNHLLKINKLMLQNLDDKYVLYQNDIEDIKIVAILKNQNLDDVLTKYNELIIKNRKEIKIDSYKICDILGCEKRTKLKEIYTDLEKKILYEELINDEVKIKQYLIKEYLN